MITVYLIRVCGHIVEEKTLPEDEAPEYLDVAHQKPFYLFYRPGDAKATPQVDERFTVSRKVVRFPGAFGAYSEYSLYCMPGVSDEDALAAMKAHLGSTK